MGGVNEAVVPQKSSKKDKAAKAVKASSGSVRFHENAGEIHFHDDAAGLKVALPVADWWSAWQKLRTLEQKKFQYVDTQNGSILTVKMIGKKGSVDAEIRVGQAEFSTTFSALQKLTQGK